MPVISCKEKKSNQLYKTYPFWQPALQFFLTSCFRKYGQIDTLKKGTPSFTLPAGQTYIVPLRDKSLQKKAYKI